MATKRAAIEELVKGLREIADSIERMNQEENGVDDELLDALEQPLQAMHTAVIAVGAVCSAAFESLVKALTRPH